MNFRMKCKTLYLLLTVGVALTLGGRTWAQSNIDSFNFNELVSGTSSNTGPYTNTGSVGNGILTTVAAAPTSVTNFIGTTVNRRNTDVAGQALAIQNAASNANNGSYLQLMTSTLGFTNLNISYATQRTTAGFTTQTLSYSIDGGTNFIASGSVTPPTATSQTLVFDTRTFDLSSITALNNNSNVIFRLTFTGATTGTGNNRIDNFQLNGDVTPAPPGLASLLIGLCVSGWKARRRKRQAAQEVAAEAAV